MSIMTEPKAILENGNKKIIQSLTDKNNVIINSVITKC